MDAVHDQVFETGRNVVEIGIGPTEVGIAGKLVLQALLRQIARELLGEQGVAFGLGDSELDQFLGQRLPLEPLPDDFGRDHIGKRAQAELGTSAGQRPNRMELRTEAAQKQKRLVGRVLHHIVEHALRGGVDPMQVLDHHHHRASKPAQGEDQLAERLARVETDKLGRRQRTEPIGRTAADHEIEQIGQARLGIDLESFEPLFQFRLDEVGRGPRDEVKPAEPFAPRAAKVVSGAWYHEEAIEDARRGSQR